MEAVAALLGDHIVQNVVLGSIFLGVTSGVLGSYAVLRQQSLLGDTLSHAALPGVCLGFILAGERDLGFILTGALVTAILGSLTVLLLTKRSRLKTDAALGAALGFFFAFGVVLLTWVQGTGNAAQGGLDSFLFGQAAATLRSDLWIMGGVLVGSLALVTLLWKELKLVTFDPLFAGASGLPVTLLEVLLTAMIALAVVIGLQMVGVALMVSMVIAPAVAARQWVEKLEHMVILAAVTGAVAGVVGALVSTVAANVATGPVIVLAASAVVVISILAAPGRGLLWEQLTRWRARRSLRGRQVLATLYGLGAEHEDPYYPAERGTLNTFHGLETADALERLERRGYVQRVRHMPDEGPHWELTDAGRREARRVLAEVGAETA